MNFLMRKRIFGAIPRVSRRYRLGVTAMAAYDADDTLHTAYSATNGRGNKVGFLLGEPTGALLDYQWSLAHFRVEFTRMYLCCKDRQTRFALIVIC